MKKKINFPLAVTLIVLLGVLLVLIIFKCEFPYSYVVQNKPVGPKSAELSFSVKSCNDLEGHLATETKTFEQDPYIDPYDPESLGVKEANWLNDTTLDIKAYVSINCAETVEKGSYKIVENKLILEYIPSGCDPCALCKCVSELNYRFTGLTKRPYQFELVVLE